MHMLRNTTIMPKNHPYFIIFTNLLPYDDDIAPQERACIHRHARKICRQNAIDNA